MNDEIIENLFETIKESLNKIEKNQEKIWEKYDEHTQDISKIRISLGNMKGWIGGILAACSFISVCFAMLRWIFK